jgi:hypothetical protein
MKDHTEVVVKEFPRCDLCQSEARYDGRTVLGPWANMCYGHFKSHGVGVGLGKGQKLVKKEAKKEASK